jgi:hypothetical protein
MAKSCKKSQSRRRQKRRQSMKGGSCGSAWQYSQSVYGGPNEQHAVSATDNQIAMNQTGGMKKRKGSKRGGSNGVFPTTFSNGGGSGITPSIYAGEGWGNETRHGGSGITPSIYASPPTEIFSVGGNLDDLQPSNYSEQAPISDQAYAVIDANSASDGTNALDQPIYPEVSHGGKKGGSFLSELTVPAVLLIGNEFAKNKRKSFNFTVKSNGKKTILRRRKSKSNRR